VSLGRSACRALLLLVLSVGLLACEDDTGIDDPKERAVLFQLNAVHNGGKTVRFDPLPIATHLPADVGSENEVTEWTQVSGGKVQFTFVGSPPGVGISFRLASLADDVCGVTDVEFDNDRIELADVRLNPRNYRSSGCQRTVTHEAGHAIGILDHTSDGGLMDPDGGDGNITSDVSTMVRNLYSLKPGTQVGLFERGSRAQRRGGRYVVTIVDYVRR